MSRQTDILKTLPGRIKPKSKMFLKRLNWIKVPQLRHQAFFMAILSFLAVFWASPTPDNFREGDVSAYTIRAEQAFRVVDQLSTDRAKKLAATRVSLVFLLDDLLLQQKQIDIAELFKRGRHFSDLAGSTISPEAEMIYKEDLEHFKLSFLEYFHLEKENKIWEALAAKRFDIRIEQACVSLLGEVMGLGILGKLGDFKDRRRLPVTIVESSSHYEYLFPLAGKLLDLEGARHFIDLRAKVLQSAYDKNEIKIILDLSKGSLQANLKYDEEETSQRVKEAIDNIADIYLDIREGEVIVREGSVISPEAMVKIKAMEKITVSHKWLPRFLGLFIALFVFFNVSMLLLQIGPKSKFKPMLFREQLFLFITLCLVTFAADISLLFGSSLSWGFDFMGSRTIFYAMPLPAAAMVVAILFGVRKAFIIAIFGAVLASVVTSEGDRFIAFLYCCNGAVTATWCLRNMNERGHLIPASFWVMFVNCLSLVGLILFSGEQWGRQSLYNFAAAIFSGLFSGIIASGFVPLVEMFFGFSTNFKLLELGNLDKPILRELMLSAPGTYHHSVIVGVMVEAGAEAIGANKHLAKVGAYYHDIGKLKKPLYFVENQSGENRHDTLSPSMSALLLIGHVRDGVDLAQKSGLPKAIVDIVEQHHGTSLMGFFYHKAKEQRQENQPEINEGDYRYPGPKPASKEAGLVMLADICEAATRSLSEPSPTKIKNMVRQLVNQVFNDGQLDECELATKEISEVINTFTNILIGIYHRRISYPAARKAAVDKKAEAAIGAASKNGEVREIYGHLPVESSKNTGG